MAEIKFYLRDPKPDKKASIVMFFCYPGHRIKIGVVDKVYPSFWDSENQKGVYTSKHTKQQKEEIKFLNNRLDQVGAKAKLIYQNYLILNNQTQPLPDFIKPLIQKEVAGLRTEADEKGLISFINNFIINSTHRINNKTGKPLSKSIIGDYKRTLCLLKEYSEKTKKKITFDNINLDFYTDFTKFLSTSKQFSTNTVGKHIKNLKTFLNDASERGLHTNYQYKSKKFKVPAENTDSIYLNEEELQKLYNLDLSNNKRLERVRDLFLIGCWTGLRFSDFNNIDTNNIIIENDGTKAFEIENQKTRNKVYIPLHWIIEEIMDRYKGQTHNSLPPSISIAKLNQYLKELGEIADFKTIQQIKKTKAGLEITNNKMKFQLLTSHCARRSFATNMYLANVPTITIMAITGHLTEKAFMKYIKLTPREHGKLLRNTIIFQRKPQLKVVNE